MTGPRVKWWKRLQPSDWIALLALFTALFSIGWQVGDAWIGANVQFITMSNRTVELRCHSWKKNTCWGQTGSPETSTGRLTVVLPVFFSNDGAVNYNAVIERVTAEVSYLGREPVELVANQIWQLVQSGGSKYSRPFVPIVVEGQSANGAELRFAPFTENQFVNWWSIAGKISEGQISRFDIKVDAFLVGEELPKTRWCRFEITKRLREILQGRMDTRSKQVRLTTTCR